IREDRVEEAHCKTFSWILDNDDLQANDCRVKFCRWLRSHNPNENFFWIMGKPGAGKSTLMKFLANNARIPELLSDWVGDGKLLICKHYFWKSENSPLQKSLIGLLRSILLQILREYPEMIDHAFPSHEKDCMIGGDAFEFSRTSLVQALERVLQDIQSIRLRLCIFIDGLDECDSLDAHPDSVMKEWKLIRFLKIFEDNPFVKVCVSSRPWQPFECTLGERPELLIRIHELTQGDIATYVLETFSSNVMFQRLAEEDDTYHGLINEIVEASQGVFLWVRIVCQTLLEGITNADRICDLQRELRRLPDELNKLYDHILESINPSHYEISARVLLVLSRNLELGHMPL
ncbi:uncharacterized protein EI97DRAFT_365591, partial [Westerdykella ornata]